MSNILSDVVSICGSISLPCEVGVYHATPAPIAYAVLVPIDVNTLCADDRPQQEVQSLRIMLYTKGSYTAKLKQLKNQIVDAGLCISDSRHIEYEPDSGYHSYAVDVEKNYEWDYVIQEEQTNGTHRS